MFALDFSILPIAATVIDCLVLVPISELLRGFGTLRIAVYAAILTGENMLALNNFSLSCGQNQLVGVFGANSAGKSTLMYTLAGIMLDILKKEEMAGGERITIRGEIVFEGRNIEEVEPPGGPSWGSSSARSEI